MARTSISLLSALWARWEGLIGLVFKPFLTDKPQLASAHKSRPRSRTFLLLSTLVLLITAPLAYLSLSYLKPAQAVWFDDSYTYRQKLTIGNTGAADTNKKVKFDIDTATLTTTKLQADCDDIRFTDINGKLLKHYLDAAGGACDTASTDYYVLVPTIHAGSTVLYMYYGNPSASNGGQSAQFSEGTFTPTSGPTASSEEEAPGPTAQWKLDEGTGSTAQDATLQNNDGSISGATWMTRSECVSGTCLSFDGTNDVVTVANTVAGIQTVSFWVRPSTTSEQYIDINGSAYIQTSSGTISATGFTDPTIYVNGVASTTVEAFTWQHITVTTGTPLSGSAIKLAQISTNYGKVLLDEIKLYPYVRSTAQIRLDYTNATSSKGGTTLGAKSDSFLSHGLVGYWKMDESTGTRADASGVGNNATMTGTVDDALGKYGSAAYVIPGNNHLGIAHSATNGLSVSTGVTFSAWARSDTMSHGYLSGAIVSKANPSGGTGYSYELNVGNDGTLRFQIADSTCSYAFTHTATSATQFTASTWHHVAGTFDGTAVRIYLNGELTGTTAFTGTVCQSGAAFAIGARDTSGQGDPAINEFDGYLDEVRAYTRGLSASEIKLLYQYAPRPIGEWKMDEKTGTSAFDTSGGNNTLSLTSGPLWGLGKLGTGVIFDGSDDVLTKTSPTNLPTGQSARTISLWIKPTNTNPGGSLVHYGNDSGAGQEFIIQNITVSGSVYLFTDGVNGTNNITLTGSEIPVNNQWNHISFVFDGTTGWKYYLNGVLTKTGTFGVTIDTVTPTVLNIGDRTDTAQANFPGSLDDVRIYNYARTPSQVIQDMNGGHPLGGSPIGSQVAYWKIDEGYSTSANDSSINSNTLTLSSATSAWTHAGRFGKAWNGDGALYMSRADDADFDFTATEDFSISGWVKSDATSNPGSVEYVFNKAAAATAGYAVYFNASGFLCFGIDDDTSWGPDISSCSGTDVYDATWHHFLAVRDYSGVDKTLIYIDGKLHDSDTDSTSATLANTLSLYVGDRDGTNNGDEFNGDIDELKVYRATLSLSDALIDYTQGSSTSLGAISDNSTYAKHAANQEYCVPGDTTSCAAPVGEWLLNEKSDGTGAVSRIDTSGNGNTLSDSTTVSSHIGKQNLAADFSGTNEMLDISDATQSGLDITGSITIEGWVNPRAVGSGNQFFASKALVKDAGNDSYGYTCGLYQSGSSLFPRFYLSSAGTSWDGALSGTTVVPVGTWTHLTCVYDGSTMKTYVNGRFDGNAVYSSGIYNNAGDFTIGGQDYTGGGGVVYDFNGKVDTTRVFNYARTPAQIAWDYNRGGPVAHYKFDECSGTTANDATGNGFSGTITPGASGNTAAGTCSSGVSTDMWNDGTTGKYNSSLGFDGTDDYVTVTHNAALTPTADYTLSAWVNTSSSNTEQEVITKFTASGSYPGYLLSVGNAVGGNTGKVCLWVGDLSSGWTCGTSAINDGTWHHVVGQLSGTTVNIYVDGKLDIAATRSPSRSTSSNLEIGRRSDNGAYFPGLIDDVRIYTYALTAAQIRNVMNEGSAVRFGPATGQP